MAAVTAGVIAAGAAVAGTALSASGAGRPRTPRPTPFAREYREGIETQTELLPQMLGTELAARQAFDPAALEHQLAMMGQSSRGVAQQSLHVSREFGPQFIDQNRAMLEQYDPQGLALRNEIGRRVLEELNLGRERSQEDRNRDIQAVRGAQAARGNMLGATNEIAEALEVTRGDEARYQQRLTNAGAFMGLPSEMAMMQGVMPGYTPLPTEQPFRIFNPSVGGQSAQYAQGNFGIQAGMYGQQLQQPNPWMQGLGMVAGVAGRYAAANPFQASPPQAYGPPPATGPSGQSWSVNPFIR